MSKSKLKRLAIQQAPAPSATVEEVMVLADNAIAHHLRVAAGECPCNASESVAALRAAVEQIVRENFTLAAGACIVDGGLVMGEYGHGVCTMMERAEKAEQEAAEWKRKFEELRFRMDGLEK